MQADQHLKAVLTLFSMTRQFGIQGPYS